MYVIILIDELDIDKRISTYVFNSEKKAEEYFEILKTEMDDVSDNPGSYFLDEGIYGKYAGYIQSYRKDVGMIILCKASNI